MSLFKLKAEHLVERAKDEFIYRNGVDSAFKKIEYAAEMGSKSAKSFRVEYYTDSL